MPYKILIGLAALFGVFQFFRTADIFARTILGGQIVAIGLTFVPNKIIVTIGFLLFMLTLILAVIYGVKKRDFTIRKRILIIVPSAFLFIRFYLAIQHHPGVGLFSLLMVIPIAAYIIAMTTGFKKYRNELGFLTIIAVDAIINLTMFLNG